MTSDNSSDDDDDETGRASIASKKPRVLLNDNEGRVGHASAVAAAAVAAPQRDQVLRGLTMNQALERFYLDNRSRGPAPQHRSGGVHPLVALSDAIGANYDRVKAYVSGADMATKKHLAGILFRDWFHGDFAECMVEDVGPALEPLFCKPTVADVATASDKMPSSTSTTRTLDLGFLNDLKLPEGQEEFLVPTILYVRDCMRTIVSHFQKDVEGRKRPAQGSTVLIGSSGVGSSLLFFLAALYQAQTTMVVYYRIDKLTGEDVSMFFMMPGSGDGHGRSNVRIWFSRNMDVDLIDRLATCRLAFEDELGVRRNDYYLYIDGPQHTDEKYLLMGKYDYFCTSGGFPRYTSAERGKRLWVLDGWTRDEAVDGILTLQVPGVTQSKIEHAYWICGGSIRDILVACQHPQKMIDRRVSILGREEVKSMYMAVVASYVTDDPGDALRTMFMAPGHEDKDVMTTIQIVDSSYCLGRLTNVLNLDDFLNSYDFCVKYRMVSAAGTFFQHIIHRAVMKLSVPPAPSVCWSEETAEVSLKQLNEIGVYWVSSGAASALGGGVHSALVYNHTLYAFHMTIDDATHDSDAALFRSNFANAVKDTFTSRHPIKKLVVYVVVPTDRQLDLTELNIMDGTNRLNEMPEDVELRIHRVEMTRPPRRVSIFTSVWQLLDSILHEPSWGVRPASAVLQG